MIKFYIGSKENLFINKRMSASSCLDYQTRRNQKKLSKKRQHLFSYFSQQSSMERTNEGKENTLDTSKGKKLDDSKYLLMKVYFNLTIIHLGASTQIKFFRYKPKPQNILNKTSASFVISNTSRKIRKKNS